MLGGGGRQGDAWMTGVLRRAGRRVVFDAPGAPEATFADALRATGSPRPARDLTAQAHGANCARAAS